MDSQPDFFSIYVLRNNIIEPVILGVRALSVAVHYAELFNKTDRIDRFLMVYGIHENGDCYLEGIYSSKHGWEATPSKAG